MWKQFSHKLLVNLTIIYKELASNTMNKMWNVEVKKTNLNVFFLL